MAQEKYSPELTAFLKKHRKYTAACNYREANVPCDDLLSAFRWKRTKEGYAYWSELSKKYYDEQKNS